MKTGSNVAKTGATPTFRVVERDTGKPVPDAELRILRDAPGIDSARTDARGVYIIPLPELPRQDLYVRVKKSGFVPIRVDWHLIQPSFHLSAEYTMPLEPGTSIGGTILDEDGHPPARRRQGACARNGYVAGADLRLAASSNIDTKFG